MKCSNCLGKGRPTLDLPRSKKPIMVIGDRPRVMDIHHGTVLKGPGGDILRKALAQVGLPTDDESIYYTTAIKCAYPRRKGKATPDSILLNCRETLIEEIREVDPEIVLSLGKEATICLTGDTKLKITSLYGRELKIAELEDLRAKPYAVVHPGMILHKPGDFKNLHLSLLSIKKAYEGVKAYDPGVTDWMVLETDAQCLAFVHKLSKVQPEYISADIETTSLDYRIAEFAVLGICFKQNEVYVVPREMRHWVKEIFNASPTSRWIWQHGKYDSKVMWRRKLGLVPLDEDTMYMHYVLDETSEHNLGYISKVYLNAPEYKYQMNQNFKAVTLETYPQFFDSLCERVSLDCDYTLQVTYKLKELIAEEPALGSLYDFLMSVARFLLKVEYNGMKVDAKYLQELDIKYQSLLSQKLLDIQNMASKYWDPDLYMLEAGMKTATPQFLPTSPYQMSWMVFKRLKLKPRIKKGTSTAKEILKSIQPQHPLVEAVLEYRSISKEHSTYVLGLLNAMDVDDHVRSTFSVHIAATGRLTSKEPNVQNQPSTNGVGNIRKAFIPEEGNVLMEIDYSGAELRVLAFLSKDKTLYDIFSSGRNLHDETSKALYGENFTKQQRMRAKAVNFGIPYGREAKSLSDEFEIGLAEAQEMIDNWLNAYPGAKKYLQFCAQAVREGKYLETPFGRRRRFGLVTKQSLHALENEARNFAIQSVSSDFLLKSAMDAWEIVNYHGGKIINLVHDSMVIECKADKKTIDTISSSVRSIMIEKPKEIGCDVPFDVDVDLGFSWGELVEYKQYPEGLVNGKINGEYQTMKLEEYLNRR